MPSITPDCICDGRSPYCAACLVNAAYALKREHDVKLTVSLLRRRIPRLTGREAAILLEATRRIRV